MEVAVCLKHVPAMPPELPGSAAAVADGGLPYEVNEADLYALEVALELRSRHGGSVTAVTVGPGRAREALYVAYAKGADRGVHVEADAAAQVGPDTAAEAVAQLVRDRVPDLILAGVQASDDLAGLFGIALAEALAVPAVTSVVGLDVSPEARTLRATCELGDGYRQEVEAPLPCVLTIQSGIVELRYMPILALARARRQAVEPVSLSSLGAGAGCSFEVVDLLAPEDGACELIEGSPGEAAARLVERLREAGLLAGG